MKIRTGFVSNSSSSSFILAFDPMPQSADELCKLLFGGWQKYVPSGSIEYNGQVYSTREIAEHIWSAIQRRKPIKHESEVILAITEGWFSETSAVIKKYPWTPELSLEEWEKLMDKRDVELKQVAVAIYQRIGQKIAKAFKSGKVYNLEFSDNKGDLEATIEHGDIFEYIPHIVINNH